MAPKLDSDKQLARISHCNRFLPFKSPEEPFVILYVQSIAGYFLLRAGFKGFLLSSHSMKEKDWMREKTWVPQMMIKSVCKSIFCFLSRLAVETVRHESYDAFSQRINCQNKWKMQFAEFKTPTLSFSPKHTQSEMKAIAVFFSLTKATQIPAHYITAWLGKYRKQ